MSLTFLHRSLNPHDGDCSDLNRYLNDPAYRAEKNAERDRIEAAINLEFDRRAIAKHPQADDEPGWVANARERVAGAAIVGAILGVVGSSRS